MVDRPAPKNDGKRASVKIVDRDGNESKRHYTEDNFGNGQTAVRQTESMLGPLSFDAAKLRRKKHAAYWLLNEKK